MRRSPSELRVLSDVAQLTLVVAGIVALGTTWWRLDPSH
jgi:hypothetical protein